MAMTLPNTAVNPTIPNVAISWRNQSRPTLSASNSVKPEPATKAPMNGQLKVLSIGARAEKTKSAAGKAK